MKKIIVLCFAGLITCLLSSCVEHITEEKPGIDPIAGLDAIVNPAPAPQFDTTKIPEADKKNPTEPTEPTNDSQNDPADEPTPDNKVTVNRPAQGSVSTALSGYPSNSDYSPKGNKIDRTVSGSTITYRVKYAQTITMIVEITKQGDSATVKASLEHYRLSLNPDKPITVQIGEHSTTALSPKIEWDNNDRAARSVLVTASAPLDEQTSAKIKVSMPYQGTYHGEKIENFVFEETVSFIS